MIPTSVDADPLFQDRAACKAFLDLPDRVSYTPHLVADRVV